MSFVVHAGAVTGLLGPQAIAIPLARRPRRLGGAFRGNLGAAVRGRPAGIARRRRAWVAIGIVSPFPATGIVVGIGFLLVVEPALASRAEDVAQFLPGAAMDALLRGLTATSNQVVLPQGIGAVVLVAWAAVLFAAAARWLERRDLA